MDRHLRTLSVTSSDSDNRLKKVQHPSCHFRVTGRVFFVTFSSGSRLEKKCFFIWKKTLVSRYEKVYDNSK